MPTKRFSFVIDCRNGFSSLFSSSSSSPPLFSPYTKLGWIESTRRHFSFQSGQIEFPYCAYQQERFPLCVQGRTDGRTREGWVRATPVFQSWLHSISDGERVRPPTCVYVRRWADRQTGQETPRVCELVSLMSTGDFSVVVGWVGGGKGGGERLKG